ncbi:protein serine/threonine phosphatase 2C [Aureobasidium pullulans]|uniref:Protein phosphatase n=1 Tax=Aureobasidium pullulans TaxID=5580 RepID=A0A4S9LTQ1_AURPU|nr:protein serine/threonine phosphatase 2C [Aureobasidium pullulans]
MSLRRTLLRPRLPAIGRPFSAPSPIRSQSTHAPFTYRLGASSSGKSSGVAPPNDINTFPQSLLDRDDPYFSSNDRYSGEDAFFMAKIARSDRYVVFGLADGVGGWRDSGIDPGRYSHGLCKYMATKTHRPETEGDLKPRNLLQFGYEKVMSDRSIQAGGCTACIGAIEPSGALEVANLGDSGFLILAPGKVSFMSPAQTHAFNTPYQLSKLTERMKAQNRIFGNSAQISETPAQSDVTNHKLHHGELVIFATDGVLDNLSAMDILKIVQPIMEKRGYWSAASSANQGVESKEAIVKADKLRDPKEEKNVANLPSELAYAIMRNAKIAGLDTRRDGPFAKEVHKYFPNEEYHGGKPDDIAVIVALAIQDGNPKAKL